VLLPIVAVAAGIVLSALHHVRAAADRSACANKLRELVFAAHKFHATNGTLPPYWGAYPTPDAPSVKGSWFCHLLPYAGEAGLYARLMAEINRTGANWDVGQASCQRAESSPPSRPVAASDADLAECREVARFNGHRHYAPLRELEGNRLVALERDAAGEAAVTATTAATESAMPGGIFLPEFSGRAFPQLQCPSDPSPGSYPDADGGEIYRTRARPWGSTNYLANWHAFANDDPRGGYRTPPQSLARITDGLAVTVLFAEGYAWCDGKGRLALNSWDYHSFGLTWSLRDAIVDDGSGARCVDFPNGMPNTYLFQVRPLPKSAPDCPVGADCCNNWRAQSGHDVLNAAMADGSVREFASGTAQRVWDHALLPRDGAVPGWEW
jgi:hypothetical protein